MRISGIWVSMYDLTSCSKLFFILRCPHIDLRVRRAVLFSPPTSVCWGYLWQFMELETPFLIYLPWASVWQFQCRTSAESLLMNRDPGNLLHLLFIGSWNHLGCKRLGISTTSPALPHAQLSHVPKGCIHALNGSRHGDSTTFLHSLFPIPDHPFSGEIFLISNLNPII